MSTEQEKITFKPGDRVRFRAHAPAWPSGHRRPRRPGEVVTVTFAVTGYGHTSHIQFEPDDYDPKTDAGLATTTWHSSWFEPVTPEDE